MAKRIDLTNQIIDNIQVLRPSEKRDNSKRTYWWCLKDGKEVEISTSYLRAKQKKSVNILDNNIKLINSKFMNKNVIDLTGQKFNRWTVLSYEGNGKWNCRCDCGTEKIVSGDSLKRGQSKSCGCFRVEVNKTRPKPEKTGRNIKDITGQVFGFLTAIEPTNKRSGNSAIWKCECTCGEIVEVSNNKLQKGEKTSCGCENRS